MVIFNDDFAQGIPWPVRGGMVIKKQALQISSIKNAKTVTPLGSRNTGELEAIKLGTDFAVKNIGNARNLFIYSDSHSAIQSVLGQNRESYHNITVRGIRPYLIELSSRVDELNMIYCPAHKSIYKNKMAVSLVKLLAKKVTHLPPKTDLAMSDLKNASTQMTIDKWVRRWAESNSHK